MRSPSMPSRDESLREVARTMMIYAAARRIAGAKDVPAEIEGWARQIEAALAMSEEGRFDCEECAALFHNAVKLTPEEREALERHCVRIEDAAIVVEDTRRALLAEDLREAAATIRAMLKERK